MSSQRKFKIAEKYRYAKKIIDTKNHHQSSNFDRQIVNVDTFSHQSKAGITNHTVSVSYRVFDLISENK